VVDGLNNAASVPVIQGNLRGISRLFRDELLRLEQLAGDRLTRPVPFGAGAYFCDSFHVFDS
jgi:hypothetical protein